MKKTILIISALLFPIITSAFTITNFRSELEVQKNGDIWVTETIKVNFTNDRKKHGIFRNIPYQSQTSKGTNYTPISNFEVTDENGRTRTVKFSKANNNHVLRIGKANQYVDENETYQIKYRIRGVVKNFEGENFDQVYWNVTGNQWDTTIKQSSAKIILPTDSSTQNTKCFTGTQGSTEQACFSDTKKNFAIFSSEKPLNPGEGLTVVYGFDQGISTPNLSFAPNANGMKEKALSSLGIPPKFLLGAGALLPFLTALFGIFSARKETQALKTDKQVIPKYQVPHNLHPTLVGTIIDGKYENRDFVAGIIHLATIGALTIEKKEKHGFLGSSEILVLKKNITDEAALKLDQQSKALFTLLFLMKVKFVPAERKEDMYQMFLKSGENITERNEYFNKKADFSSGNTKTLKWPKNMSWWVLIPIVFGLFANFIFTIISVVIGIIGISIFSAQRTKKGFEMAYELECYKEFLKTAEIDQLNWASKQEIFEKNLPYAVAFGLEDKWTQKFGNLIQVPNWAPAGTTAAMLTKDINKITQEFERSIQAPQSSGGSGFSSSGGGFSGGGSGGGGGSSW